MTNDQQDQLPLFDTMSTMRAMRRLRPDPVPDELLERLVQAAVWAPSGSNLQQFHYVVVTDRQVIARLEPLWRRCVNAYLGSAGKATPPGMDEAAYGRMVAAIEYQRDHFADTPALIIPCYRYVQPKGDLDGLRAMREALGTGAVLRLMRGSLFSTIAETSSVYPGVQNLLLAARGLGLGATITVWHLMLEREWKQVLGIPKEVNTFAVIPVGRPVGNFGPVRRRPVAEVLHRDGW
ncbi:MAG: nitroreductase family protein [Streptomyces sp.]|uniref:nitroreductase family protein n=1 Tax=Streptomyces sp. TaxID=1931 RepID=UPI003D6B7EDF